MSNKYKKEPNGIILREHVYDGIQEYDQKLPNWWLFTLYGAIAFSVVYWFSFYHSKTMLSDTEMLDQAMHEIAAIKENSSIDVTDDTLFVEMSQDAAFVEAGKVTYSQVCFACHGQNLEGGIGENLVDAKWIHGSEPSNIYATIYDGVPEKGMQAWGSLLGQKKIAELTAFILSKQDNAASGGQ